MIYKKDLDLFVRVTIRSKFARLTAQRHLTIIDLFFYYARRANCIENIIRTCE